MTSNLQTELIDLVLKNEDEALARALLLSERHGDSPDSHERLDVADALYACARQLIVRGRSDAAGSIAEELASRFRDDPFYRVQAVAAAALSLLAELQVAAGELAAGIATYDEALSVVALSGELTRRGAGVALLLAKAIILERAGQCEEALVVLDSALQAVEDATGGKSALRTRQAALAVLAKLDNLIALGRYAELPRLGEQISRVFARLPVGPSFRVVTRSAVSEPSESSLAGVLAEVVNEEECWNVFEGRKLLSSIETAGRACRLYWVSDPWVLAQPSTNPANTASFIVRAVADGYALLAGDWSPAERSSLPLPHRAVVAGHQLTRQGLADWATAHGHPLALREPVLGTAPRATPSCPEEAPEADVPGVAMQNIIKCIYLYELIRLLSDSEAGLQALRYKGFRSMSPSYLRAALEWGRSVGTRKASNGRGGVAVTCWLIAQRFFALTHTQTDWSMSVPSAEAPLREFLHETGGDAWLLDRGVSLPAWSQTKA